MKTIGVISDTHGYIDPRAYSALDGVELILHAGDIGNEDVIASLETVAPVQAVWGNVDAFPLTTRYPEVLAVAPGGVRICVIHQYVDLRTSNIRNVVRRQLEGKLDILIYGHSHQARLERAGDIYLFNPGSAGKRRFSLRPAVGLITIYDTGVFMPEVIYLDA